jgi:hypothetical protein
MVLHSLKLPNLWQIIITTFILKEITDFTNYKIKCYEQIIDRFCFILKCYGL